MPSLDMYMKDNARQMHTPKAASGFLAIQKKKKKKKTAMGGIRTRDILHSKRVLYQLAESNPKMVGSAR